MDRSWITKEHNHLRTREYADRWRLTRKHYAGVIVANIKLYEESGVGVEHPYPTLPSVIFGSSHVASSVLNSVIDWKYKMMMSELDGDVPFVQANYEAADHIECLVRPYNRIMAAYASVHPETFDSYYFMLGFLPTIRFSVKTANSFAPFRQERVRDSAADISSAYVEYCALVEDSQWCYDQRKYGDPQQAHAVGFFAGDSFCRDYFMAVIRYEAARVLKKYHGRCW